MKFGFGYNIVKNITTKNEKYKKNCTKIECIYKFIKGNQDCFICTNFRCFKTIDKWIKENKGKSFICTSYLL